MKYKIGDKVRVKEDLEINKMYGSQSFADGMAWFRGKVMTVTDYFVFDGEYVLDGRIWIFTDEMLEPVGAEEETKQGEHKELTAMEKRGELSDFCDEFCSCQQCPLEEARCGKGTYFLHTIDGEQVMTDAEITLAYLVMQMYKAVNK